MAIYRFDAQREQLVTIDSIPDFRTDVEKQLTPLSIFDHGKPDIAYAERLAEEIVNVSGAWVTVFIKEPKDDAQEIEVWDEDADPLYRSGKKMKAYFKPEPNLVELTKFGVDVPIRTTIVFARAPLMLDKSIGSRLFLPGDVIEAPYNLPTPMRQDVGPKRFRVLNAAQEGFFQYRWLYVKCSCELLVGDEALSVKTDNRKAPPR